QAFVDDMFAAFRAAAEDALRTAEASFDPSLTITGSVQPTVLGIPMGPPDQELSLMITKDSLGFEFQGSITEQVKSAIGNSFAGPAGRALMDTMLLGATDSVTVGVQI